LSQRVLILFAGCAAFLVLTAIPAKHFGGDNLTYVYSGTAMLLCLIPGIFTLLWAGRAESSNPQQMPIVLLAATGVRMFGVLIAGFLLTQLVPLYHDRENFLIWLLVCYLFTLALEMTLLLKGRSRPS
jgi:hypothetical protein